LKTGIQKTFSSIARKEKLGFCRGFPIGRGSGLNAENPLKTAAKSARRERFFQVRWAWLLERSAGNPAYSGQHHHWHTWKKRRRSQAQIDAGRWKAMTREGLPANGVER